MYFYVYYLHEFFPLNYYNSAAIVFQQRFVITSVQQRVCCHSSFISNDGSKKTFTVSDWPDNKTAGEQRRPREER